VLIVQRAVNDAVETTSVMYSGAFPVTLTSMKGKRDNGVVLVAAVVLGAPVVLGAHEGNGKPV